MIRLITILLLLPMILSAESLLEVSSPLDNRVFFKFDSYPNQTTSRLSDDKKQIIINIPETKLDLDQNTFVGKGNISSVDLSYKDNALTIYINLKDAAGYTIAPLKSISMFALETFDWSKINKQEDLYRNSLLAYESGLTDVALEDLRKSDYKNAKDELIDILLTTKDYENAVKMSFDAYNSSNMPIHLAVISEIANNLNDTVKSSKLLKKIESLTGIKGISLNKSYKLAIASLDSQYESELDSLNLDKKEEKNAEQKIAEDRFKNIFSDTETQQDSNAVSHILFKDFYGFPWWVEYVLYFVLIAVLLVIYLYLKWRNRQILALKEFSEKKRKIEERKEKSKKYHKESKEVEEDIEKGLAERKKNHESKTTKEEKEEIKEDIDTPEKDEKVEKQSNFSAEMLKAQQLYSNRTRKETIAKSEETELPRKTNSPENKTNRQKRANKIEQIIDAIRTNSSIPDEIKEEPKKRDYSGLSAKMQLAMKISDQELEEKNKQLSRLENLTDEELDRIAKELGTGKASIETKKNLQDLLSDQDALDKLAKKFNKRE